MDDRTAEQRRLDDDPAAWRQWGPYLAERAWGTVREDYSPGGTAWEYLPHEDSRSRAYRWSEDGLGGISDVRQSLCFAWSFWNGEDPILKERLYGLTGNQGNHGEDAKELWWFLDATPSHSFLRWRYWYPQAAFPYDDLLAENQRRTRLDPEYDIVDTGIFDEDRYWDITVDYAKATPDDLCIVLRARNAGPDAATLHVLPTLWFRNTWSWGHDDRRPSIAAQGSTLVAEHHTLGTMVLAGPDDARPLACENESNAPLLWNVAGSTSHPKDGIGDHVLHGAATVNPTREGTKATLWSQRTAGPGETIELRFRLAPTVGDLGTDLDEVVAARAREADAHYAKKLAGLDAENATIARQALAGMIWTKQFYHYDVARWLDGDPALPPPPEGRKNGRNHAWRHLNNHDIISVCDTWEYPWYASWDLGFQCVAFAHIDPSFAKHQLLLLCREWFMHPNGQVPAYEWSFDDVNPPVHAWAVLRVFEIDGSQDLDFLARMFQKLLLNFTWWVNRKDTGDDNVFQGGFLGMDNVSIIDRSAPLPAGEQLEQSDATGWMAMFCLNMLEIAIVLADRLSPTYEDMCTKFLEHFAYIAHAIDDCGLWDEEDGFYYDLLRAGDTKVPFRVRSIGGLLPLCAVTTLSEATLARLPSFAEHLHWFVRNRPELAAAIDHHHVRDGVDGRLLAIVGPDRLERILKRVLDEAELLSPHGVRSVSAAHRAAPFCIALDGEPLSVDYEPAESTTGLFGGNSNWRGPVWFPVNALVIEALRAYGRFFGDDLLVEHPTRSGNQRALTAVADDVADRLVALFREGADGRRPAHGTVEKFHTDPEWHGCIPFFEYFHGDTGAGLGASHQTGWTGLVADLLLRRPQP